MFEFTWDPLAIVLLGEMAQLLTSITSAAAVAVGALVVTIR